MIGNGTWYFYGETPAEASANATERLIEAVEQEKDASEKLFRERKGVAEFKAKEEAGFEEGISGTARNINANNAIHRTPTRWHAECLVSGSCRIPASVAPTVGHILRLFHSVKLLRVTFSSSYRPVAAALLSLFLCASALHASIIYWDPPNVTIDASAVSQPYYVSLLTGEVTPTPIFSGEGVFVFGDGDVLSDPSAGFLSVDMTITANRGVVPNGSLTSSPAAARFSANDIIDGTDPSLWTHSFEVLQNNFAVAPDWSLSESLQGFVGLSLQISGGVHYGWARVSRNGSEYTLLDFAYHSTAESPIAAGAVPEPSTLSGIGSFLVFIWLFMLDKRRRMESKKYG